MLIGGVLLAAGTEMHLPSGIRFILNRVVACNGDWVVLSGTAQPTASTGWSAYETQVQVSTLKRLLALS